jgi:CIC family chloride channel protein
VLADDGAVLAGWLNHREVLRSYRQKLTEAAGHSRTGEGRRLGGYRIAALTLDGDTALAGLRIEQVEWPPSTRVVALRRCGEPVPVRGDTVVQRGDRLTVLVPAEHADGLADLAPQPACT